ncbi:MAG: hypothetical protein RR336_02940 [Oscillospiraceae bacterium]
MRQFQDVNGGVIHSEREYDIAPATKIEIGQVVKMADGLVVPAAAGEVGAILGYAAESHNGTEDALNQRADGKKILVQDGPGAIAVSAAPTIKATGGTATTITAAGIAAFAENAFKGGYVKGPEGFVRRVTASAVAGGALTLTVDAGIVPVKDQIFTVFPPVGFAAGNLSAEGTKIVLTATAALPIQVVGRYEDGNIIYTMATKHLLAAAQ